MPSELPAFPSDERRGRRFRGDRRRGRAANICDRSGRSSVDGAVCRLEGESAAAGRMLERPSGGGTAGVVRWLARTRQAVHPFTRSLPPAPSRQRLPPLAYTLGARTRQIFTYTSTRTRRRSPLSLLSELSSVPSPLRPGLLRRHRSRFECERSLN